MSSQGLDQPGVLVAYVKDVMAEGTAGTGDTLLGISTVVLIFPIATSLPSSSSALDASSSPAPLTPLPHLAVFGPDWEACTFQETGKITCVQEAEWC